MACENVHQNGPPVENLRLEGASNLTLDVEAYFDTTIRKETCRIVKEDEEDKVKAQEAHTTPNYVLVSVQNTKIGLSLRNG